MDQLLVALIVFGPPAVMLLVAQACRLGLSRLIASLLVFVIMVVCAIVFGLTVADTYPRLGESEADGAFVFACFYGVFWLMGGVGSLVVILLTKNVRSPQS